MFRLVLTLSAFVIPTLATAENNYSGSGTLAPSDYLFGSHGKREDSVFDRYQTIDLGVDLGIGADCGRIDVRHTMRAALSNILDAKYMEDMGRNIVAASPMLAICYFSPTWCAILKNFQMRASMLANMRLDQCSLIDKYVDTRVEDYQQERQRCVRKEIANSDGNFEKAMESCGNDYYQADIANWAGGEDAGENRLLESSANWAGFTGADAKRVVSLVKSFVGDTVIKRGNVSVDFGSRQSPVTPRTYLSTLQTQTYKDLCEDVIRKVQQSGGTHANLERAVTDGDLRKLSGDSDDYLIDRQTIMSLAYMPYNQRRLACRKLSDAMAMTVFTTDMSRSLDFLSSRVVTNPNLPEHRKVEADRKRVALKDQIEMTLALQRNKNEPLNEVLQQINQEGVKHQDRATARNLSAGEAVHNNQHSDAVFMDCADSILCSH